MKKLTALLVAVGMVFGASGMAMAATANGTSTATIVTPIGVTSVRALDFGSISTTSAGGSVALTAIETTVITDTTVVSSGTQTSGKIHVTGGATNSYTIAVPATVTLASTSVNDDATMSATLTTPDTSRALLAGVDDFYIGGTLTVGTNQNDGAYSGSYVVTVAYQ